MKRLLLPLAPLALLVASCGTMETACDLGARPAVAVRVVDSLTSDLVQADSLTITVTDGAYSDSKTILASDSHREIKLAPDRAGTYQLVVQADGYDTWSQANIVVPFGECHVETVEVTVRLQQQ